MPDFEPLPFVSIIIPTFNEETYIHRLFDGIAKQSYRRERFEIIVVDNGSTDKTQEIATKYADQFLIITNKSVAGVRNYGASHAKGDLLAFLDGDCIPDKTWIEMGVHAFVEGEVAFGNKVTLPKNAGWIERGWFSQRTDRIRDAAYINSANFFVTKKVFLAVGGFDETLRSGEDWDICQRIRKAGYKVRSRPEIKVVHLRNPNTVFKFIRREIWHGIGGLQSFMTNPFDKPLWATFFFVIATIMQIGGLIFKNVFFLYGSFSILFLILLSSASNVLRFHNYKYFFHITVLYYFYFIGRTGSIIIFLAGKINLRILRRIFSWLYGLTAGVIAQFNIMWRAERSYGLRILCYHSVSDLKEGGLCPGSNILLKNFKEQMQLLIKSGFYTVSLAELERFLDGKINLPPKSFIVTFDDGYKNIKNNVVPFLSCLGISCIIFITTDYIGCRRPFPFEEWTSVGGKSGRRNSNDVDEEFFPLTVSDIVELSNMGNVLIGSHSSDHRSFIKQKRFEIEEKLVKSRQILENITGRAVNHFAYPYGAYDRFSFIDARKVYTYVYSVEKGKVKKGSAVYGQPIYRHSIKAFHSLSDFKTQIYGGYDPFRRIVHFFNMVMSRYVKFRSEKKFYFR